MWLGSVSTGLLEYDKMAQETIKIKRKKYSAKSQILEDGKN